MDSSIDDRGPLDLERQIDRLRIVVEELKKDNYTQAKEIDRLNEWIYDDLNDGVYKCGLADSQEAYETAIGEDRVSIFTD